MTAKANVFLFMILLLCIGFAVYLKLPNGTSEKINIESSIKDLQQDNSSQITPKNQEAKEASGCPKGVMINKLQGTHKLKNQNKLLFCGFGELDQFWGEVYFEKYEDLGKLNLINSLGGTRQAWGDLSAYFVSIKFEEQGFYVTELIPYRAKRQVPFIKYFYKCSSDSCINQNKEECVFEKLSSSPSGKALSKIERFLDASHPSPEPKDFTDVDQNVPTHEDIFNVYFDALDGHTPSIQFLTKNNTIPEKIKAAYKYESPESTISTLSSYIRDLRKMNCL